MVAPNDCFVSSPATPASIASLPRADWSGARVKARDRTTNLGAGAWPHWKTGPRLGARDKTMDTFASRSTPPPGAENGGLSDELLVALYEHMVLARTLDAMAASSREGSREHATGCAPDPRPGAVDDEATILGAVAAMQDQDWVFPGARGATAGLWRGMPLAAYTRQLFVRAGDGGGEAREARWAPDAPFWKAARVASVSPLVGTQIPHAVGLAWAARMRKDDVAALVFLDESAKSSGDFHAALNFAGVMRAPVVAVCRSSAARNPTSIAYGLHGATVDGADVEAVVGAVRQARRRAAAGLGGTLVEAVVAEDPVARTRGHLERRGLWNAERERRLQGDVGEDVERALDEARAADRPARGTLFDDVYAGLTWPLREQRRT